MTSKNLMTGCRVRLLAGSANEFVIEVERPGQLWVRQDPRTEMRTRLFLIQRGLSAARVDRIIGDGRDNPIVLIRPPAS
jgi:hypothetical protein